MSPSFMLTMSLSYLFATLVRSYDSHDAENSEARNPVIKLNLLYNADFHAICDIFDE